MYRAPSSGLISLKINVPLKLILKGGLRLFSDVWSENAALFERLMEIHSNPPILCYGFNTSFLYMYPLTSTVPWAVGGIVQQQWGVPPWARWCGPHMEHEVQEGVSRVHLPLPGDNFFTFCLLFSFICKYCDIIITATIYMYIFLCDWVHRYQYYFLLNANVHSILLQCSDLCSSYCYSLLVLLVSPNSFSAYVFSFYYFSTSLSVFVLLSLLVSLNSSLRAYVF